MERSLPERKTDSDKEVRHLFNEKAATWNQKYEFGGSLTFRVTAFCNLVAHELSPNDKVLDLGCGTGAIAAALADGGFQVTACDVAEKMIDAGKRIHKKFPIQWCLLHPDWKKLPFDAGTFDGLVASSVFEYLPDVNAVFLECERVLKPGGILIATVPNPRTLTRKFEKVVRPAAMLLDQLPGLSRIPRLHSFTTYLKCSRNRMSLDEWWARGAQAHLKAKTPAQAVASNPSLNFLVLRKMDKEAEQ